MILDLDEQQRIIAECDENLCGPNLTPSERAEFTACRKEAYEALHPETRAHVAGGTGRAIKAGEVTASANLATAFTADTAAKTGQSERAVQRDAERGAKVSPEALAIIRGTKADTGSVLDRLKGLPRSRQVGVARAEVKARPKVAARNAKAATGAELGDEFFAKAKRGVPKALVDRPITEAMIVAALDLFQPDWRGLDPAAAAHLGLRRDEKCRYSAGAAGGDDGEKLYAFDTCCNVMPQGTARRVLLTVQRLLSSKYSCRHRRTKLDTMASAWGRTARCK